MSRHDAPGVEVPGVEAPGVEVPGVEVPDTPPARSARASAWVAVLAVLAALLVAPSGVGDLTAGEFARVVSGRVEVREDAGWDVVAVGETIAVDDTVRTVHEPALLSVRGGSLSLARSTVAALADGTLTLTRGAVLFESDDSFAVALDGAAATGRGTWRVDAGGLARFASYLGGVAVEGVTDDTLTLGRLQEVPLVGTGRDRRVQPLRYLARDPWDERLLADAIAVDRTLASTTTTLASRYGTALQERSFYADFTRFVDLLPQLDRLAEQVEPGGVGPPAPTLVALIVADLLVDAAGLPAQDAAVTIDRLREAGATWGLIVVAHDLAAADLDVAIDRALRQRGEELDAGTAVPVQDDAGGAADGAGGGGDGGTGGDGGADGEDDGGGGDDGDDGDGDGGDDGDGDGDGGGDGDGNGDGDGPDDPPEDDPGTLDPVEDGVTDVGDLLDPIVPGSGELAEDAADAVDTVDDLLPGVPSSGGGLPSGSGLPPGAAAVLPTTAVASTTAGRRGRGRRPSGRRGS